MSETLKAVHFHIHWSPSNKIDWESFDSEEAAEARALAIQLPNESHTIDRFDESCGDDCGFPSCYYGQKLSSIVEFHSRAVAMRSHWRKKAS
jgi:hypothetical protein